MSVFVFVFVFVIIFFGQLLSSHHSDHSDQVISLKGHSVGVLTKGISGTH